MKTANESGYSRPASASYIMVSETDIISLKITLRYRDLDEFCNKYAENISSAGLFIRTKAPKPTGTKVRFELLLVSGERVLKGEGVVVTVRADEKAGMALRFNNLDPDSQEVIHRVVASSGQGSFAPTPLSTHFAKASVARANSNALGTPATWPPADERARRSASIEPESSDKITVDLRKRRTSAVRPWDTQKLPWDAQTLPQQTDSLANTDAIPPIESGPTTDSLVITDSMPILATQSIPSVPEHGTLDIQIESESHPEQPPLLEGGGDEVITGRLELPREAHIPNPNSIPIVGIDLGERWIRLGIIAQNELELIPYEGAAFIPALVAVNTEGNLVCGSAAQAIFRSDPNRTISPYRLILGPSTAWVVDGHPFERDQVLGALLGALGQAIQAHTHAPEPRCLIAVPSNLPTEAGEYLRSVSETSGLHIVELVPEWVAAVNAYHLDESEVETVLVLDVGGSHLALALLHRGERGMALAKSRIIPELSAEIEAGIIHEVRAVLESWDTHPSSIGKIVMAGSAGAYPPLVQAIQQLCGQEPLSSVPPANVFVLGLAKKGAARTREENAQKPNHLAHAIGIELPGGRFLPLIRQGEQLPITFKRTHATTRDNQTEIELSFYQGDREMVSGCTKLGQLVLTHVPKGPRGTLSVDLHIEVDRDQVVRVALTEQDSGRSVRLVAATPQTPEARKAELQSEPSPDVTDAPDDPTKTGSKKFGLFNRLLGRS